MPSGVDIEDVATIQGDTAVTGFGAGAARQSQRLHDRRRHRARRPAILRERIVAIAAHQLEAAVEDIELAHSRASVRGTPSVGISFGELARIGLFRPVLAPAGRARRARGQRPLHDRRPLHLGQRHPRVHLRGGRRHRLGQPSCATSSARTAAR